MWQYGFNDIYGNSGEDREAQLKNALLYSFKILFKIEK